MAGHALSKTHQVTVLEARDRVGGRVWTLKGPSGRLTEGGAELIGYAHHLWMMLAAKFELGLSVLTSDDDSAAMGLELPLWLDGRLLDGKELEHVYNEMTKAYDHFCRTAVKQVTDPNQPWLARRREEERPAAAVGLDRRPGLQPPDQGGHGGRLGQQQRRADQGAELPRQPGPDRRLRRVRPLRRLLQFL